MHTMELYLSQISRHARYETATRHIGCPYHTVSHDYRVGNVDHTIVGNSENSKFYEKKLVLKAYYLCMYPNVGTDMHFASRFMKKIL